MLLAGFHRQRLLAPFIERPVGDPDPRQVADARYGEMRVEIELVDILGIEQHDLPARRYRRPPHDPSGPERGVGIDPVVGAGEIDGDWGGGHGDLIGLVSYARPGW